MMWEVVDWTHLAHNKVQLCPVVNAGIEQSSCIKSDSCLVRFIDY